MSIGASFGHICVFFLFLFALTFSESLFILSSSVSVSISSSQADLQTLKIDDFSSDVQCFLKNQRSISDDGPESVLGLSWGRLWCSWGRLGSPLGYLEGLLGVSWDPFGDLSSTKKFLFELLMASVDLDVFVLFSSLLLCSCFSSFGVVMLWIVQDLLDVSTEMLVLSEIHECLDEIACFEI